MKTLDLIIEKGDGPEVWGRITVNDNLIVDSAESLDVLKAQMKNLVREWEGADVDDFTVSYDLTAFFEQFDYLKISKIAEKAGMNSSLLRHYSNGTKQPSADQVKRIEDAVHVLAAELAVVHLVAA